MNTLMLIVVAGLFLAAVVSAFLVLKSLKRQRIISGFVCLLLSLVFVLSALLVLVVAAGTIGYKALVREDLAATVYITPLGTQQFQAKIVRPGAPDTVFAIAGDDFYMDARILKWKPLVNILGLHTAYCLDRVAGRYRDLRDEKSKVRTIYSLHGDISPWDIFQLRTRFTFLAPILDAQYGSAAFIPMQDTAVLRILVTTSGLIARPE